MRSWTALLVVAAALGVLAAGTILLQARRGPEPSRLPSAANPGPRGLAAGQEMLRAGAVPVWTRAVGTPTGPGGAVVIVAAPGAPLGPEDAAALLREADGGATVLVALGAARQPALLEALGLDYTPGDAPRVSHGLAPHPLVGDLALPATAARLAVHRPGPLAISGDGDGATAVSVPAGRGEVVVLAGAEALENARILDPGALSLWTRLGALARGREGQRAGGAGVVFDERFLSPPAPPPPPSSRALALLAGQLLAAGAALVWARGRRLGAVRPAPAARGDRTARAYLAALAALYRRTEAEEELAARAWIALRRRLDRRWAVPARLSDPDAARRISRRSPAAALAIVRGSTALTGGGRGVLLRVARAAAEADEALAGRGAPRPSAPGR